MAVTASAHRSLELADPRHLTGVHPNFSIAGEVAPRTRRFARRDDDRLSGLE